MAEKIYYYLIFIKIRMQKIILFKFKIYILSKHLNVLRNLTIQITEYQEVHNNMQYT